MRLPYLLHLDFLLACLPIEDFFFFFKSTNFITMATTPCTEGISSHMVVCKLEIHLDCWFID